MMTSRGEVPRSYRRITERANFARVTRTGDSERFRPSILERSAECAGATDVGRARSRNEDAYWIAAHGSAFVVADGLGGLPAGDVASALAVEAVAEVLEKAPLGTESARSNGAPAPEQLAQQAAARAQRRLLDEASARPGLLGMATTLVIAQIEAATAWILHVGDSRAALWRKGRFVRTTFDHNGVGDLLRAGAITAEQARHYPGRNMVREVVGLPGGYQAEVQSWPLEAGDVLLLCTDGVSESLGEEAICHILATAPNAAAAAAELVTVAGVESGHDNATAIVHRVT